MTSHIASWMNTRVKTASTCYSRIKPDYVYLFGLYWLAEISVAFDYHYSPLHALNPSFVLSPPIHAARFAKYSSDDDINYFLQWTSPA